MNEKKDLCECLKKANSEYNSGRYEQAVNYYLEILEYNEYVSKLFKFFILIGHKPT